MLTGITVLLTGCSHPSNDRITLGGSYVPPSLRQDPLAIDLEPDPVLFGLEPAPRSQWDPIIYLVPFDGVVHGHLFQVRAPIGKTSTPREYGRFPTRRDALRPQSSSWGEDIVTTIGELGRSVIGTPYALVYFAVTGKLGEPTLSPRAYKRTPRVEWATGSPAPIPPDRETEPEDRAQ